MKIGKWYFEPLLEIQPIFTSSAGSRIKVLFLYQKARYDSFCAVNAAVHTELQYFCPQMHIDIPGDILYSDTTRQNLIFDMEGRIPENSEVTMAELKLFKKPLERKHLPRRQSQRPVTNARVSVYWVQLQDNGTNRTSLIDSRYE